MKKLVVSLLLCMAALGAAATDDVMLVYLNDGSFKGFYNECIDSIVYSNYDLSYTWHDELVTQEIWTADSVSRILIDMIDSIAYEVPEPVYKSEVVHMDESYLKYVVSASGMTVTFSKDMPEEMRPKPGDVLLYEGTCDVFPHGFAGRVGEDGIAGVCDSVDIEDIYDRFYLFGSYQIVQSENEEDGYLARQVRGGRAIRMGDDNKGFFENVADLFERTRNYYGGTEGDYQLAPLKKKIKLEFEKYHLFTAAEVEYSPTVNIELAWDAYIFSETGQYLFYKCTLKETKTTKFTVGFSVDGVKAFEEKFKTGEAYNNNKSFYDKYFGGEWFTSFNDKKDNLQQKDNDDGSVGVHLLDISIPIPQCPVISVGAKAGFFVKPSLEGELSYSNYSTETKERTYIYKRTDFTSMPVVVGPIIINQYLKEPDMDKWFDGPSSKESGMDLKLKGKLAVWAGVEAGLSVGTTGGNLKMELTGKFGPYIEGALDIDFLDAIEEKSWYSLVQDTKLKSGLKFGINGTFKGKFLGAKFSGSLLSIEPKELLLESEYYMLPSFTKPGYQVKDDHTLVAWTDVTRNTLSNVIGFQLVDEEGNKINRFAEIRYTTDLQYRDNPFSMTFDNLDFTKHHYTIYAITRPLDLVNFKAPEHTMVTCMDSHHPHLIDLGLPSGTQWACCNVYADDPVDEGGYYQWGMPMKVTYYDESSYKAPLLNGQTISGTQYDAATANWGSDYVTPSQAQFEELLEQCTIVPDDVWLESERIYETDGIYVYGNNGNVIYLPYAGCMFRDEVYSEPNRKGYYLIGDVAADGGHVSNHVVVLPEPTSLQQKDFYGYSVRPVRASMTLDQTEFAVASSSSQMQVTVKGNENWTARVTQGSDWIKVSPSEGKGGGTLTIEVAANNSASPRTGLITIIPQTSAPIVITVTQEGVVLDVTVGKAIDLGLPSGLRWASWNIGAESREEVGEFFAWGETMPKDSYTWENYRWCNGNEYSMTKYNLSSSYGLVDKLTVLEAGDDAASALWQGHWRTPTIDEVRELMNNCTWTWKTENGVKGYLVTSKTNGNDIFIPCTGAAIESSLYNTDNGYYLSSSVYESESNSFLGLGVNSSKVALYYFPRNYGLNIRPVASIRFSVEETELLFTSSSAQRDLKVDADIDWMAEVREGADWLKAGKAYGDKTKVSIQAVTNTADVEREGVVAIVPGDDAVDPILITVKQKAYLKVPEKAVNLGLPSGTLWAPYNIGASKPEAAGDYFAWGEVEPKDSYTWATYKWCNGSKNSMTKYNSNSSYGAVDNRSVLEPEDDAATQAWGDAWKMPTHEQLVELTNECLWTRAEQGGVTGYIVSGKAPGYTDNSIFIPSTGYKEGSTLYNANTDGDFWTLTGNEDLGGWGALFKSGNDYQFGKYYKYYGFCVRAVASAKAKTLLTENSAYNITSASKMLVIPLTGDDSWTAKVTSGSDWIDLSAYSGTAPCELTLYISSNKSQQPRTGLVVITPNSAAPFTLTIEQKCNSGNKMHDYVDLGLPSGKLWAASNVGAQSPEDFGDYFAWGEVEPKNSYEWATYKWSNDTGELFSKYISTYKTSMTGKCDNLRYLQPEDDAATVNLGPDWHTPTHEEIDELVENTNYVWTQRNGVPGMLFTGKLYPYTEKSMFIPAAGFMKYGECLSTNYLAIWSNTHENEEDSYCFLWVNADNYEYTYATADRCIGIPVRAVYDGEPEFNTLTIEAQDITLGTSAAMKTLRLFGEDDWTASVTKGAEWLSVSPDHGDGDSSITLKVTSNTSQSPRFGIVYIVPNEALPIVVKVTQNGTGNFDDTIAYTDLGLPSGILWADYNMDADTPEDFGSFFAWGELMGSRDGYAKFDWSNYKYCKGKEKSLTRYNNDASYGYNYYTDALTQLLPEDDVANVRYGGDWYIPTAQEWNELKKYCTIEEAKVGNVYGNRFTSTIPGYTDRSIFLPRTDMEGKSRTSSTAQTYYYWTSTLYGYIRACGFNPYGTFFGEYRYHGLGIRPVNKRWVNERPLSVDMNAVSFGFRKESTSLNITGDDHWQVTVTGGDGWLSVGPELLGNGDYTFDVVAQPNGSGTSRRAQIIIQRLHGKAITVTVTQEAFYDARHSIVDLGLPSHTLWASCNVGASSPEGSGNFYAWGETSPKSSYTWDTYRYYSSETGKMTKYNDSSLCDLTPDDDAASVNWGENWRIPTESEWTELVNRCNYTWTTVNGVQGGLFRSRVEGYEDQTLFIPAAGGYEGSELMYYGEVGYIWLNRCYYQRKTAYFSYIYNSGKGFGQDTDPYCGLPVRAIWCGPSGLE